MKFSCSVLAIALSAFGAANAHSKLRSIMTRSLPILPEVYCEDELKACEADKACANCIATGYIPDTPEVDAAGFNCDVLNEWFTAIEFDDPTCELIIGHDALKEYIYCLYDIYKWAGDIDICETGETLAPTAAPTASPTLEDEMGFNKGSESSMTDP